MASSADLVWASAPLSRIQAADDHRVSGLQSLQVPVVDLSEPDCVAAPKMRAACRDYGFLYVANHGIRQDLVTRQFEASKRFFELPLPAKMALRADHTNRGYFPFGMGSAKNAFSQDDRKEAFNVYGFETHADDTTPFHGLNKWPGQEQCPGFRETMEAYYAAMHAVALRVLRLLALALDLPASFFEERFAAPIANVRAVHYLQGQPSNPEQGVFGVGPHTDWGALTILATDGERGLQICLGREWIDVEPHPGHFVVNLGDMVDRWTSGRFRSTLHRVVNTSERFSTPFFLAPNWDAQMDALPGCTAAAANPTEGSGSGATPAPTCGAWLTMRRTAEYDKKLRRVEAEGEAPDRALPRQQQQQAPPQIRAQ